MMVRKIANTLIALDHERPGATEEEMKEYEENIINMMGAEDGIARRTAVEYLDNAKAIIKGGTQNDI